MLYAESFETCQVWFQSTELRNPLSIAGCGPQNNNKNKTKTKTNPHIDGKHPVNLSICTDPEKIMRTPDLPVLAFRYSHLNQRDKRKEEFSELFLLLRNLINFYLSCGRLRGPKDPKLSGLQGCRLQRPKADRAWCSKACRGPSGPAAGWGLVPTQGRQLVATSCYGHYSAKQEYTRSLSKAW